MLSKTGNEECNRNPLPNVPVHFLMAGGFTLYPEETPTIYVEKNYSKDRTLKGNAARNAVQFAAGSYFMIQILNICSSRQSGFNDYE